MFLKGGDFIWMPPGWGESYRGGYISFLFFLDQLDRRRFKLGVFIVYGYHLGVSAGVHGKLIYGGGHLGYLENVGNI